MVQNLQPSGFFPYHQRDAVAMNKYLRMSSFVLLARKNVVFSPSYTSGDELNTLREESLLPKIENLSAAQSGVGLDVGDLDDTEGTVLEFVQSNVYRFLFD